MNPRVFRRRVGFGLADPRALVQEAGGVDDLDGSGAGLAAPDPLGVLTVRAGAANVVRADHAAHDSK
jgi:hypothetical protein